MENESANFARYATSYLRDVEHLKGSGHLYAIIKIDDEEMRCIKFVGEKRTGR